MIGFDDRCRVLGCSILIFSSAVVLCLMFLAVPAPGVAAMGQIDCFPTTSGSSWYYAGSGLTLNDSGLQVVMPMDETVTVQGNGAFHSAITFSNGNTTTTDNMYFMGDALYVVANHNVLHTVQSLPISIDTTTTTDTTYSPAQEYFPAEVFAGNMESSTGQWTTAGNTVTVTPYGGGTSPISKTGTQSVIISVEGNELVTVGAGTFPGALRLSVTIESFDSSGSSSYSYTAWYAEGVGLVKFTSPNLNRDLVSYAVNPVEPSPAIQIPGNPGSFTSMQSAFSAAANNDTLNVKAANYQENAVLNHPVNIVVKGGLSSDYTRVVGYTNLQGSLTVNNGSMVANNLLIY